MRCFVYGTLRPGDYNHERVGGSTDARRATASGRLYCVFPSGGYPGAKFQEEGTIVGDVVYFGHKRWPFIMDMETGAGYSLVEIPVTYEDGSVETMRAFQYDRQPDGPWIESGDWFDFQEPSDWIEDL